MRVGNGVSEGKCFDVAVRRFEILRGWWWRWRCVGVEIT